VPSFVSGLELARAYWSEIVAPVLDPVLPKPRRAAALFGEGSEVLGFDTEQSTVHAWGPRVFVLVDELDREEEREFYDRVDRALPETFRGFPTRYPGRDGAPVRHQVRFSTFADAFESRIGVDPSQPLRAVDWLRAPTQQLRACTAGAVFEDASGALAAARRRLAWYPDDAWIYVLACQWQRVAQEEAFVGRCGQVGDELGAGVVATRLVRDLMRLCFLIERVYAPYSKWLGTAFARLRCGAELGMPMRTVLHATDSRAREAAFTVVAESIATMFNGLGLVPPIEPTVRQFYRRPFVVLGAERFAEACIARTSLRRFGWIGAVDQFVDNTDVLSYPARVRTVTASVYADPYDPAPC
jgi:hypothetical protein